MCEMCEMCEALVKIIDHFSVQLFKVQFNK